MSDSKAFPQDSVEAAAAVAWLCGTINWKRVVSTDPMARAAAGAAFMAGIRWERERRAAEARRLPPLEVGWAYEVGGSGILWLVDPSGRRTKVDL